MKILAFIHLPPYSQIQNYQYKRKYVSKIKLWSQNKGITSFLYVIATQISFLKKKIRSHIIFVNFDS